MNYKLFDNDKCGLVASDRIANGMDAGLFEFPWAARLGYLTEKNAITFACGGTLISEFYVITAAHCLVYLRGGDELNMVRLGEYNENTAIDCIDDNNCADPIQDIGIESFVAHPKYDRMNIINDIGLIRLVDPANLTQNNIKPICLPFDQSAKRLNNKYTIIGFGRTENGQNSPVLQKATIPEYDSEKCEKKFAGKKQISITSGQLCAGGEGKTDACKGDSGSSLEAPALMNKRPRKVLYGIVSYGVKFCGQFEGYPGIYTRVTEYLNWIMDNMH